MSGDGRARRRHRPARRAIATAAAVVVATVLLTAASPAPGWSLLPNNVPYPYDTITYWDESAFPGAVRRGLRAWNRAGTGYRFVKAESKAEANLLFSTNRDRVRRTGPCTGAAFFPGYNAIIPLSRRARQSEIVLNGRCGPHLSTLAATHEIGHILTLGHASSRECAVMVSIDSFTVSPGRPRFARPASCPPAREYWRAPIRHDDREGGLAARARPYRMPLDVCYPEGGDRPPAIEQDILCNRQYDCRGIPGTAPLPPDPGIEDDPATGRPRFLNPCRESAYDVGEPRLSERRPASPYGVEVFSIPRRR